MKRGKKIIAVIAAITLLAGTFASCGSDGDGESTGAVTLDVALLGDPISIDPAFAYDNDTSVIMDNITEALLTHNPDNSLKPNLCSSWEAVDDVTYVYQIRDDINFSNGNAMTMDDVVFSLQRHMDADLGSYMNLFFENVESIEATGDWELTVKLKTPDPTWKYVLATSAGMIIEKAYAEEHSEDLGTAEVGVIGTGPFVFESWENGSKVVLTKNENYWDESATTNIDEIVFSVISDDTTLATAIKSGQIDMSLNYSDKLIETFKGYDNVEVIENPGMGIHYFAVNTAREPFNDVNVRKAIAYAIDIDSIYENIIGDQGDKGGLLPMSTSLFTVEPERWEAYVEEIGGHEYNIEKAKEYLAQSSVPDGFDFNILVSQAASQRYDVALVIQEALKELNINAEIQTVTSDEFYTYQFGNVLDENGIRDYDALVATWGADYPDPSANLTPLYTTENIGAGGYNCASYENPEVDRLLEESKNCASDSERMDKLFEVCDIIIEDMPYYVYNYTKVFGVISNDWDGGDTNFGSAWDWNFKNVVYNG